MAGPEPERFAGGHQPLPELPATRTVAEEDLVAQLDDIPLVVSRTGWSNELGYESSPPREPSQRKIS